MKNRLEARDQRLEEDEPALPLASSLWPLAF